MSTNLIIQYTAVAILIILALIWIVVKSIRARKNGTGCSGCSLAEKCAKAKVAQKNEPNTDSKKCNNPAECYKSETNISHNCKD